MDFVYMCRSGSNEELKYSIRSVYANAPDPCIWLVGGKPDWYKGNHIPVAQSGNKHENVRNNLRALCSSDKISNSFILMNDDFFIINKISSVPYLHGGSLSKKVLSYKDMSPTSKYTKLLVDTENKLREMNINSPLDYAIHVPMPIEKDKLSKVIYDDLSVRTMYGNIFNVGGLQIEDVKVYADSSLIEKSYDYINGSSNFISTNDNSFNKVYADKLKNTFKNKSECEK